MRDEFAKLLADLIKSYGGTKQDFARAARITPSSLSHLLAGADPGTEVCLRIAQAAAAPASRVLRAAGKGETADLIESLFGAAAERRDQFTQPRLTMNERRHLEEWRGLEPAAQRAIVLLTHQCAQASAAAKALPFRRRKTTEQ